MHFFNYFENLKTKADFFKKKNIYKKVFFKLKIKNLLKYRNLYFKY